MGTINDTRNSRNILTSKWKSLQLKPITGDAIVSMRRDAYKMMSRRKSSYDTKPNWQVYNTYTAKVSSNFCYRFLEIKKETMSICNDAEDADRDNVLSDLQQFSNFDDRSVQFIEVTSALFIQLQIVFLY